MIFRNLTLILFTLFGLIASLNATILYTADGTSVFKLIDADSMAITATTGLDPPSSAVAGTGTASIDADSQTAGALFPGMELTQTSEVSGSAAPSLGTSMATVMNGTLITLDNTAGLVDAVAEFEFSYDWFVEVIQTDPTEALSETGYASSFFHLTGFTPSGMETLAIDEGMGGGIVPVADWLFHPEVSFDFADIGASMMLSGSKTVTAYVTVKAGGLDAFSVITDAFGAAAHIPEPASLLLISLALLSFGLVRRRKI